MGADIAAAAIEHARHGDPAGQAAHRVPDTADKSEAETLHAEFGDAHVCMRGVLHQCEPDDRQGLVDRLAVLVGERGRAFLVEPSEAARPILGGPARSPAGPPPELAPVFLHGIALGEAADEAVPEHLRAAGRTVLAAGEIPLTPTGFTHDGTRIVLPSKWLVAGRTR